MKAFVLFCSLFFYIATAQTQQLPSFQNSYTQDYPQEPPVPRLWYPFPNMQIPFVQGELFTFIWGIDSVKYPPEIYPYVYDFRLVRINAGQTPEQAILNNPPVYSRIDIADYYFNYPWNAPILSEGYYAWRVSSKQGGSGAPSPAIAIYISDLAANPSLVRYDNYYTELREKPDASFQVAHDSRLLIKYEELYEVGPNQKLRFKVYNNTNEVIIKTDEDGTIVTGSAQEVAIKTGLNYLTLNFETTIPIYWGIFYLLEVWNAKNERWYLRFTTDRSDPTPYLREAPLINGE